uniref:Late embryogenesis abundant protein LEA-2 subgroup domain-containing protein n=1 Tax=Leersia perrieri TaxID=77586 RepID=A0A0D9XX35_9ORYZ
MSSGQERTCCGSLFTFIVTAGFVILIYWAIFQPHHIRATVVSGELTNLTVVNAGAAVSYSVAVKLNLYNPSLRVNIYYDELDSQLRLRGNPLGHNAGAVPGEFYQRRKSSDEVTVSFAGVAVAVPGDAATELEKEKGKGSVSLELAVDGRVRYRFGSIKIRQKPKIWCSLTFPVNATAGGAAAGRLNSGERCSVNSDEPHPHASLSLHTSSRPRLTNDFRRTNHQPPPPQAMVSSQQKSCCRRFFTSMVTTGFVILIYWAIFQPHYIRATVVSADLTNLAVANATVSYAVAVKLSLYNPSLRVNIYYDELDCELRFRNHWLGHNTSAVPGEFYQRRKRSNEVTVSFTGDNVAVAVDAASELEKEKGKGSVSMELAVDGRVRYKFGTIKIPLKPKIWCSLTFPVNATAGRLNSGDRCSVKF